MSQTVDLCFVSDRTYRYLDPSNEEPAGGAQRQQYLLASELSKRGYQLGFVVGDYGQPAEQEIDGMVVVKGCPGEVSSVVSVPCQFRDLLNGMKSVDADTYYVRGAPRLAVATWACSRILGKKFVFCVANDADVNPPALRRRYPLPVREAYRRVLRRADVLISQTENQAETLRETYGLESTVIPNGYDVPPETDIVPSAQRENILWVGSSDPEQKQPTKFLELADALPEIEFVMISQPMPMDSYHETLREAARRVPNLQFVGRVSPDDVHDYYRLSELLVNTSQYEGFPNTFLEAWRYATPVASLSFDIDSLLEEGDVGVLSGNMDRLVEDVARLHEDVRARHVLGMNGRELLREHYSLEKVADSYAQLLLDP